MLSGRAGPRAGWPVPVRPDLAADGGGWIHRYVADGAEAWAGPHLGIYPGIWFAARALAAVADLRGGVPDRWHVPRVWFRGAVHPGDRVRMRLARRGAAWRVEHAPDEGGPPRAVMEIADTFPEGAPFAPDPPPRPPPATSQVAEDPSEWEVREVAVARASVAWPWVEGELVAPPDDSWLLRGFPPAPSLWMVEALGQLSFVGMNRRAGRRRGEGEGPARYVAGRLAPVWLDNRAGAVAGEPFRAWMRLVWGNEAAGVARAAAATPAGVVVAAMECLFARVTEAGEGPGSAFLP